MVCKALASLDSCLQDLRQDSKISIHKALASLDIWRSPIHSRMCDFNPQGSREPRLDIDVLSSEVIEISIHKALASLDEDSGNSSSGEGISIHKALASLDTHICTDGLVSSISIHKALASLDSKSAHILFGL